MCKKNLLQTIYRNLLVVVCMFFSLAIQAIEPPNGAPLPSSQPIEIAITVDDLPESGPLPSGFGFQNRIFQVYSAYKNHEGILHSFTAFFHSPPNLTRLEIAKQFLAVFKKHHLTGVYGFVVGDWGGNTNEGKKIDKLWKDSGQLLGNHTYSHHDYTHETTAWYINDILKDEPYFVPLMGPNAQKYFRFPFLSEGNTQAKRDDLRKFFVDHHYIVAQVSMNYADYDWSAPYVRCLDKHDNVSIQWLEKSYMQHAIDGMESARTSSHFLFNRDIKYILLTHLSAFNAVMLDKMLTAYEARGVKFISLSEALKDPVYQINPNDVDATMPPFLEQIMEGRHMAFPAQVKALNATLPVEKLTNICT